MWISGLEWDARDAAAAGLLEEAVARVSPEVRARYRAAPRPENVRPSVLAEALLRLALHARAGLANGAIRLERPAGGKPRLAGSAPFRFSLTHSGDRAYCALASAEVGLDAERLRSAPHAVARRFFTDAERAELAAAPEAERDRVFFALWTLKESFVKREGTGIAGGLGSFSVTLAGGTPALAAPAGRSVAFRQWFSGDYVLAACADGDAAAGFPAAPDLFAVRPALEAFLALPE